MIESEFYALSIGQWPLFVFLISLCSLFLFRIIRGVIIGGVFDPLSLTMVAGYSVNYAVIIFLWIMGESSSFLTFLILSYGVVMILVFRQASRSHYHSALLRVICWITPPRIAPYAFYVSLFLYLILSFYVVNAIGFGLFAATNRFDVAQGYGAYIRIMDLLTPFILSFSVISIFINRRFIKLKIFLLFCFVLYAAAVNGAKISVIFSLCTVFFTLSILASRIRIRLGMALSGLMAGIIFSIVALSINLTQNNVADTGSTNGPMEVPVVVERFIYRIIANGDSSYLLIPNDVIERIEKDGLLARFIMPLIGVTTSSKIFGYPLGDFSLGRQALLYYNPNDSISGGPTSHFDLFAYAYFGPVGGFLFAIFVGLILGSINRAIRITRESLGVPINYFKIALLSTLWTRAVAIIVEPTVGFAYIMDTFVFFGLLSLCLQLLPIMRRGALPSHVRLESSSLDSGGS